jgi:hypothetical protein
VVANVIQKASAKNDNLRFLHQVPNVFGILSSEGEAHCFRNLQQQRSAIMFKDTKKTPKEEAILIKVKHGLDHIFWTGRLKLCYHDKNVPIAICKFIRGF